MRKNQRALFYISIAVFILCALSSSGGLFIKNLYRDSAIIIPQTYAQDLLNLILVLPIMVISFIYFLKGSFRGKVALLGCYAFMLYTYTGYAFGCAFNVFFLNYVALYSLSIFGIILIAKDLNPEIIKQHVKEKMPVKLLGIYFITISILIAMMWLSEIIPAMISGTLPKSVVDADIPTNFIQALDLGIIVPFGFVTGILILKHNPWGYLLSGVLLIKGITIGWSVCLMIIFMSQAGFEIPITQIVLFFSLSVMAVIFSVIYLRNINPYAHTV